MHITKLFLAPISVSDVTSYLLMNCQGSLVRSDRGSAPKAEHFIKTQKHVGEQKGKCVSKPWPALIDCPNPCSRANVAIGHVLKTERTLAIELILLVNQNSSWAISQEVKKKSNFHKDVLPLVLFLPMSLPVKPAKSTAPRITLPVAEWALGLHFLSLFAISWLGLMTLLGLMVFIAAANSVPSDSMQRVMTALRKWNSQ